MSELQKCKDCNGSKQVRGCGFMLLKCAGCNGIGWIEEKLDKKQSVPALYSEEGARKIASSIEKNIEKAAEQVIKKRGRPAKVKE